MSCINKINREKIAELEKCYALAPLRYKGKDCFLVASEVINRCLLFNDKFEVISTIWEEPGGTMALEQIPNTDGEFLAIQNFYGPDDSKESKIVYVKPYNSSWIIMDLVKMPHIHRFGIIESNECNYLIISTLKTNHKHEGDWSSSGKVYYIKLPHIMPSNLELLDTKPVVLIDNLFRNHGFYKRDNLILIGSDNGIHKIELVKDTFNVSTIYNSPVSDMWPYDIDQDGVEELLILAPFHGPNLSIIKPDIFGHMQTVYKIDEELPFLHAIWGGVLNNNPMFVIGNREGRRELFTITFDRVSRKYMITIIDSNVGPANVLYVNIKNKDFIISANRETDTIKSYYIE